MMGPIGKFSEEFWNVEVGDFGGWEIVSQRVKESNKITTNYISFLKQVAAAMDTFGRTLLKSAKNSSLPDMEHGELKTSLHAARESVETWGQDSVDAAAAIISQTVQLTQHLTQSKLIRKHAEEEARQRQQQVRDGVRRVRQAQRDAQNKVRELVDTEAQKQALGAKPDVKPKELEKVTLAEERAGEAVKEAEVQHKDAVTFHNSSLDEWCTYAHNAFDTFQDKEETRVELIRDSLWGFANICSLLAVRTDQHQEVIRTALLRVDVAEEVTTWVARHKTLQTPPIPLVHVPVARVMNDPPSATPSARSTIAEVSDSSSESSGRSSPIPLYEARVLYQFSARPCWRLEASMPESQPRRHLLDLACDSPTSDLRSFSTTIQPPNVNFRATV
ncbi:proline-serine-threonine phosphatase-interacting protein 2 isoform X2 [Procambarus clarkii]|uniref:proline-serine-threonine phosphatase-interacting protein 2 isoform X2 n=2 Tax=Procambarus clarkii TaxID=6728 RepID=UPI0037430F8A